MHFSFSCIKCDQSQESDKTLLIQRNKNIKVLQKKQISDNHFLICRTLGPQDLPFKQTPPNLHLSKPDKIFFQHRCHHSSQVNHNKTYSAFQSCQGRRSYNQDRIMVIENLQKEIKDSYHKISYYAIFDGHGGHQCSQFMRENFHKILLRQKGFPSKNSLHNAFLQAQLEWQTQFFQNGRNQSGTCALIALQVDNMFWIGNVGDSRAIMVAQKGKKVLIFQKIYTITKDHKPTNKQQQERIIKNDGSLILTQFLDTSKTPYLKTPAGPLRFYPGFLSVSRTLGDLQIKYQNGVKKKIISWQPEIFTFQIEKQLNFMVMGSDGLFDVFSNEQVGKFLYSRKSWGMQQLIIEGVNKGSTDNISCVMVGFNQVGLF